MFKAILYHCAALLILLIGAKNADQEASPQIKDTMQADTATGAYERLFAKKLYNCLRTNNVKEWIALYPDSAEFKYIVQKTAATKEGSMKADSIGAMVAQRERAALAHYTKEFEALQQRAREAGLQWNLSAYSDFSFDKGSTVIGSYYLNGDILLKANNTEFVIEGIEAVETAGGYRLQSIVDIKKIDPNE